MVIRKRMGGLLSLAEVSTNQCEAEQYKGTNS